MAEKHILIVEDEEPLRDALSQKLRAEGFMVHEAKDGEEGLTLAKEKKPALLIVDVLMPKVDGIEMLRKLRDHENMKRSACLILTNLNISEVIAEARKQDDEELAKAIEEGEYECLVKSDIHMNEVIEKVKQILL